MKKVIFLVPLLFFIITVNGQKKISLPTFKNDSLSFFYQFLRTEMEKKEDAGLLDSICLQTASFIKFKISENGEPFEIEFNYGSDSLVSSMIKQIIADSKQYWKPSYYKKKPCISSQIVLPVQISYDKGCKSNFMRDKNGFIKYKRAVYQITNYSNNEFNKSILENCILLDSFGLGNKSAEY